MTGQLRWAARRTAGQESALEHYVTKVRCAAGVGGNVVGSGSCPGGVGAGAYPGGRPRRLQTLWKWSNGQTGRGVVIAGQFAAVVGSVT